MSFQTKTISLKWVGIVAVACIGLTACQSGPSVDPKVLSAAKNSSARLFSGEAGTYTPSSAEEKAVASVLSNGLVAGYNGGDQGRVSGVLTDSFEKRLMVGAGTIRVFQPTLYRDSHIRKSGYGLEAGSAGSDHPSPRVAAITQG